MVLVSQHPLWRSSLIVLRAMNAGESIPQSVTAGPAPVEHQFALTCTLPVLNGQRSLLLDILSGTFIQQVETTKLVQASIGSP